MVQTTTEWAADCKKAETSENEAPGLRRLEMGGLKPMEKTGKGLNHGFLGPCLQNLGCRKGIHIGNCFCKYTIHEGQVGSKPCKDGWLDLTETIPALCVYSSNRLATDNED